MGRSPLPYPSSSSYLGPLERAQLVTGGAIESTVRSCVSAGVDRGGSGVEIEREGVVVVVISTPVVGQYHVCGLFSVHDDV